MLSFLISRPIAVTFSFLGLVVLGLLMFEHIPISLIPDTETSKITVQVSSPNTASATLDQTVIRTLRSQLMQVDHLRSLSSRTRSGSGTISLSFDYDVDGDLAFLDVNEHIDQAMPMLPRTLERPRVLRTSPSDIPVLYLSVMPSGDVQGGLDLDFSEFMRSTIQRRLEQLETVAFADITGYAKPEVVIRPDMNHIQALGLSIADVEQILQTNNVDIGNFLIQDGQYQYNVRMLSEVRTVVDISSIYFQHRGTVLRLSDIASISLEEEQRVGGYIYNDTPAVLFSIRKKANARLLDLRREITTAIQDFEASYPQMVCKATYDQSAILRVSIDNLISALTYGSVFAMILMILFYRAWREPLMIAISIPIALVIALLGFYAADISINVISLSGLILGVGLMIDNSIIVIDNIRQRQSNNDLARACVLGTEEVIRPLISSMLTTCAVFIPLVLLSGLAGSLFYDLAISIVCALVSSLLVAYFLLPVMYRLLYRKVKWSVANGRSKTDHWFERSTDLVLRYRWVFLFVIVGISLTTILSIDALDRSVFPDLTRDGIAVEIDWNNAITLDEASRRVGGLHSMLSRDSLITASNIQIGQQDFLLDEEVLSKEEVRIFFFGDRLDAIDEVIHEWAGGFPDIQLSTRPLDNIFDIVFAQNEAPLIAHIQSLQSNELIRPDELDYCYQYLKDQGIVINPPPRERYLDVQLKDELLALYDIPRSTVQAALAALFNRRSSGTLRTSLRQIPITIANQEKDVMASMKSTFVQNQSGGNYPLGALIDIQQGDEYKVITADEGGLTVDIALPYYSTALVDGITKVLKDQGNHTVRYSGQHFENEQTIKELAYVLVVVLLLLFFILSAQFESLKLPFIILLDVPVSLIGAFWILYWTGQSLNLVSMVGLIVASGIIVNDSILKVDMIDKAHRAGKTMMDAIHIGGRRRLRPIIMTSLTTILAMVPILFSDGLGAELQYPLALTIIGGLVFGTIMSLYFVPVLYYLIVRGDSY